MQNQELGVTKDTYFEICEFMGNEPIDSEIPTEIEDFPDLVQQSFSIYYLLPDTWEPMAGSYLGKDMTNLFKFFDLYDIESRDRLIVLSFIKTIDGKRSEIIRSKRPAKAPA